MSSKVFISGTDLNKLLHGLEQLNKSMEVIRTEASRMFPETLLKDGLIAAIRETLQLLQKSGGINLSFNLPQGEDQWVDEDQKILLFRIFSVMLLNIQQHDDLAELQFEINYFESGISMDYKISSKANNGLVNEILSRTLEEFKPQVEVFNGSITLNTLSNKVCQLITILPKN